MSDELNEARRSLVGYLCTLEEAGARVFTMADVQDQPCAARISRQAMYHLLEELAWEGCIASHMGSYPRKWRITSQGFTLPGDRDTTAAI